MQRELCRWWLGNAAVDMTVGEFFLEDAGFGGAGKVGVQNIKVFIFVAEIGKSLAVAFAGCLFN